MLSHLLSVNDRGEARTTDLSLYPDIPLIEANLHIHPKDRYSK